MSEVPQSLIDPSTPPSPDAGNLSPSPASPEPNGGLTPSIGTKPDGLPEQFWDPTAGLKTADMVAEFQRLSEFEQQQTAALGEFPAKADDAGKYYTLPENLVPEGVTLPDGVEVTIDENNPLIAPIRDLMFKNKIPAPVFHDLVRAYVGQQIAESNAMRAALGEEKKKLGARGPDRVAAVDTFLKSTIGPELAGVLTAQAYSAKFVEALETLQAKMSAQGNVIPLHQKRDDTPPETPKPLHERLATSMWPSMSQGKAS